ncbi:MAG TPA: hypothetical protein VG826_07690 [Pirellulales bacterium]|nr:hypothetical protein [Pirellulales bacterium]
MKHSRPVRSPHPAVGSFPDAGLLGGIPRPPAARLAERADRYV